MTAEAPPQGVSIGPTWLRDEAGRFVLPELTLGWQILGWTAEYLLQPDGPDAGEPWKFTDEQARLLLWWYEIDDHGLFTERYGMLRRMKGWGKDPFAAALCSVEFVGPCRFGGWRGSEPLAIPHSAAWVQAAAVSKDQTRNTMTLFPGMLSQRAVEEFNIDLGKEIIYAHQGRCRIEAVTSSPRALEGPRATFTVKNETHHWLKSNEGVEMSAVIALNAAKSRDGSTRVLAISNAHSPGEGSDAEQDYEAWEQIRDGLKPVNGFLYDSLEAPEETQLDDPDSLRAGLPRGDSDWVHPERIIAEIQDPKTPAPTSRRFYLNQIVAEEDRPFDRKRWDELADLDHVVPEGALIGIGFDGSINRDWTAAIGTEIATGFQWPIGIWEPEPNEDGELMINVEAVDQTMTWAFGYYNVWRLNGDPFWWRDTMSSWAGRFGKDRVVDWPTNKYQRMAYALLDYRNAIQMGDLSHDGDNRFAAAIGNAHKQTLNLLDDEGNRMWVIHKERPDSPNKIDPAVAAALSWRARADAIALGVLNDDDGPSMYEDEDILII